MLELIKATETRAKPLRDSVKVEQKRKWTSDNINNWGGGKHKRPV